MLLLRNGFYAFEDALHVLPSGRQHGVMSLENWNYRELWANEYGEASDGLFFFAEDAFGNQFCLGENGVYSFDAETSATELLGRSLEDWAGRILTDYGLLTGFPLMHEWQVHHGSLPRGSRLVPTVPFVLGGEYSLSNLSAVDAVEAMKSRGNLARQIRDLPDGSHIEIKVID